MNYDALPEVFLPQDEKLARGLARQLLRQLQVAADLERGTRGAAIMQIFHAYRSGVIPNVIATGLALRDRIRAAGPFLAWSTVIPHPTKKRIVVKTVIPCVVKGAEQDHLVCAGGVYDLTRGELGIVETSLHTAISHHTLTRLYQRGDFSGDEVLALLDVATAFVAPLLHEGGELRLGPNMGVAIPFLDGLLLGAIEFNPMTAHEGPSFGTVTRAGTSEMEMLELPFGVSDAQRRGVLVVVIETFVGPDDLYPNQVSIRDELVAMRDRLNEPFRALRTAIMYGFPDPRMIKRFGPLAPKFSVADMQAIRDATARFFATPEWERQAEAHGQRASAIRRRDLH